jgi:Fe-S cluster biosynthesis and repair protein YggX
MIMEKTLKVFEQDLREQIAQEIETYIDSDSEARAFTLAADIARGKK